MYFSSFSRRLQSSQLEGTIVEEDGVVEQVQQSTGLSRSKSAAMKTREFIEKRQV